MNITAHRNKQDLDHFDLLFETVVMASGMPVLWDGFE